MENNSIYDRLEKGGEASTNGTEVHLIKRQKYSLFT